MFEYINYKQQTIISIEINRQNIRMVKADTKLSKEGICY